MCQGSRIICYRNVCEDDLDTQNVVRMGTLIRLAAQRFQAQVRRGAPEPLSRRIALLTKVCRNPICAGQAELVNLCHIGQAARRRSARNSAQPLANNAHRALIDALFVR